VSPKQALLERSALSRLRLRQQSCDVRAALHWPRVTASMRFVALASRALLYARLLRSAIALARSVKGRA